MATPTPWPIEDINKALALKAEGLTWRDVGKLFGKSRSAAQAACARYLGTKPKYQDPARCGPPIGLEQSEVHFRKECKVASEVLRGACLDLFQRTANRHQINLNEAMARHLGPCARPTIPGCERAIRGQFAERRLAA